MGGLPSSGGPGPRSAWARDATIFFTTIAVLLGTGILGLPIKLVDTGFAPFVVIFTLTLGMQLAIVWVHADTLQRAQRHVAARIALDKGSTADLRPDARLPQVDLHTMGRLYLTRPASLLFDAAVLLTFISTLISYSLAGANAFSQLLGVPVDGLIVPFVGVCTFLIVFASGVIAPVVSVLTFIKVLLLTFIIGTCGVVASRVGVPFHSSWADVMSPFLVGTVAIGGIGDMMPVFFTYRSPTASDVAHFRWSIAAGILVCYALNVVWARAVLGIVPQTAADAAAEGVAVSLQAAGEAGDIATAPVIQVINASYPQYRWVASTVTAFITLSISVSFNAVGLGIKHVLDGMAVTALRAGAGLLRLGPRDLAALEEMGAGGGDPHGGGAGGDDDEDEEGSGGKKGGARRSVGEAAAACAASLNPAAWVAGARAACASRGVRLLLTARGAAYAVTFGSILGVALEDPSGFISVLEIATSSALNMAGGVFVVLMYVGVRAPPRGSLQAAARAAAAADAAGGLELHASSGSGSSATAPAALFAGKAGAAKGGYDDHDAVSEPLLLDGSGGHAASGHAVNVDESAPGRVALRATAAAVDPGIPSPLHEGLGAALAGFCLATFAAAVLYDVYNAGVSKGAYGPGTGAWIAAGAGALLWRFVGRPTGALLAAMCAGGKCGADAAAQADGDEAEGDEPAAAGAVGRALAAALAPGVTDAVADTALALAVAWGNALPAPAGAAAATTPSIAAGIALGVHALVAVPRSAAGRHAAASDALSAAAAVAVVGLEGAAGHAGPAAVAGVIAAVAAGAAAARACGAAGRRR